MSEELKDEDCWFIGECPICNLQMGFHVVTRLPKPKFYCERCKKYYHMKDFHDYWIKIYLDELALDSILKMVVTKTNEEKKNEINEI